MLCLYNEHCRTSPAIAIKAAVHVMPSGVFPLMGKVTAFCQTLELTILQSSMISVAQCVT